LGRWKHRKVALLRLKFLVFAQVVVLNANFPFNIGYVAA
jgi:hypothetical protein